MDLLCSLKPKLREVEVEICDLVFDYFNILQQEYNISREKWAKDKSYLAAIANSKSEVDD